MKIIRSKYIEQLMNARKVWTVKLFFWMPYNCALACAITSFGQDGHIDRHYDSSHSYKPCLNQR